MDELTIPSCLSFDSQYYSDRWRRVAYGREESKPLRGRVFKNNFREY